MDLVRYTRRVHDVVNGDSHAVLEDASPSVRHKWARLKGCGLTDLAPTLLAFLWVS